MVNYCLLLAIGFLALATLLFTFGMLFPEIEPLTALLGLFAASGAIIMCICGLDSMEQNAASRAAEKAPRSQAKAR